MSHLSLLRQNPVIAAVKDNAGLQLALRSNCQFISLLFGNICTISHLVAQIKKHNKYAFIHVDLLEGASNKEIVIDFLRLVTQADGIISTKASMLKAAREQGFFCIHRFFLVDSISYHNLDKQVAYSNPDCIEILPGCMPKVLGWVANKIPRPLIAGGLVCDEEDARAALNAGATALSTTNTTVWELAKILN